MLSDLPVPIDGVVVVASLMFVISALAGYLLARPTLHRPRLGIRRPGRRGSVSTDPGAPVGPA
jgi:hypothetical protein